MNNSENFKKAHKIAKRTVRSVGNYSIAFSLALKVVIKIAKQAIKLNTMQETFIISGMLNAGQNMYVAMVAVLEKTIKMNAPKKAQKYNWAEPSDNGIC